MKKTSSTVKSEDNIQHIYPIDDDGEHLLHCMYLATPYPHCPCPCRPKYEETENGCLLVIHNAYDGREGVEWARELLSR